MSRVYCLTLFISLISCQENRFNRGQNKAEPQQSQNETYVDVTAPAPAPASAEEGAISVAVKNKGDDIEPDEDYQDSDKGNDPEPKCYTLDFEDLAPGTVVDEQYQDIYVDVVVKNFSKKAPDLGVVFDSRDPQETDKDLKTPGKGKGNTRELGNLLIIAENKKDEDNDDLIDTPDDEADGGIISFNFSVPVYPIKIDVIDIEEQGSFIEGFESDGKLRHAMIPDLGDNSVQTLDLSSGELTDRFDINLKGSGAVDNFKYCLDYSKGSDDDKGDDKSGDDYPGQN